MIDWEQPFPIASRNPTDLSEYGLTGQSIAQVFPVAVMTGTASRMQEAYNIGPTSRADFNGPLSVFLTRGYNVRYK